MANLILPSRFTRQPTLPCELDASSPFIRDLRVAVLAVGNRIYDLSPTARQRVINRGATIATRSHSRYGAVVGPLFAATTSSNVPSGAASVNDGDQATFVALMSAAAVSNGNFALCFGNTGGGTLYSGIMSSDAATKVQIAWGAGTNVVYSGLPTWVDDAPHLIAATVYSRATSPDHRIFLDGAQVATSAASLSATNFSTNTIGVGCLERGSGPTNIWPCAVYLALGFRRALSPDEHAELASNPWQLFKEIPRRIFFDVGAGAGINISVSPATLTVEAVAPTVKTEQTIGVLPATIEITSVAPQVTVTEASFNISVDPATLTVASEAPLVNTSQTIQVSPATLTLESAVPQVTVAGANEILVPAATLSLSGVAPDVKVNQTISVGQAELSITSVAPTIRTEQTISIGAADLTLTGVAPIITAQRTFLISPADIVITTVAPLVAGGEAMVLPSAQQPAGKARKPSKRKRRPVVVEIDGEDFVVSSEAEAEDLLTVAKEAAETKARAEAADILRRRQEKAKRDGRLNTSPLRMEEPAVVVRPVDDGRVDRLWVETVRAKFDEAIEQAYEAARRDAEIVLLMAKQTELDEEDALVALLLTI